MTTSTQTAKKPITGIKAQWMSGGFVHSRTWNKENILKRFYKEGESDQSKLDRADFDHDVQISTANTWIDHEKIGFRVCLKDGSVTRWIDHQTASEALDTMLEIENLLRTGISPKAAWEQV